VLDDVRDPDKTLYRKLRANIASPAINAAWARRPRAPQLYAHIPLLPRGLHGRTVVMCATLCMVAEKDCTFLHKPGRPRCLGSAVHPSVAAVSGFLTAFLDHL